MKSLCVFVGENKGKNPAYLDAARKIGKELVERNITLIYGGGRLGLMGVLADTVLENNGQATGIITKHLYEKEAHLALSQLHIVESMQERKKLMLKLADGFIALPGGFGTLEEMFEIWNMYKLGIFNKPFGLLNTNHYFNKLIEFIEHGMQEEFLKEEDKKFVQINDDPIVLLDKIAQKSFSLTLEQQHTPATF